MALNGKQMKQLEKIIHTDFDVDMLLNDVIDDLEYSVKIVKKMYDFVKKVLAKGKYKRKKFDKSRG